MTGTPLDNMRNVVLNADQVAAADDGHQDEWMPDDIDVAAAHRELHEMPANCPVEALGINGDAYYYLDASRQMRVVDASKHTRLGLLSLFGSSSQMLYKFWPRYGGDEKKPIVVGWRPELVAENLMAVAAAKGVLDVGERVRGPGAWTDENGQLVIHCGDLIYSQGKILGRPGMYGRHIYPSAPSKPRPLEGRADRSFGEELLELLKSWNWRRPDLDPYLLMGWIGASMVSGALDWRPLAWITGDKATGKSTLHKVLQLVHGPGALLHSSDPSAAGLWQTVGHSSLPIALDEIEAEEDNRKVNNVIKLARHAASGGRVVRGGTDHKSSDFTVRSCFLFSSILIPPLLGQDISRMAILQLDKLTDAHAPSLKPQRLAEIGAALRRRLMDNWPRMADTLECYRVMLSDCGHGGRAADQFGTLMACYDLLVSDDTPRGEELDEWKARFAKETLAETEEDIADHQRCVAHLLTTQCDMYRAGERRQIGAHIAEACGRAAGANLDPSLANRALASYGLKADEKWLYVANNHQGTAALFANTHWTGRSGATGVWVQALRRVPGAEAAGCIRFDGVPSRCTRIPIDSVIPKHSHGEAAA